MSLTRNDLEDHERRLKAENERVISVLKDVAIQFNTIANQLLTLSRTTESIAEAQSTGIAHIETELKDRLATLQGSFKQSLDLLREKILGTLASNVTYLSAIQSRIETLTSQIGGVEGKIDSVIDKLGDAERETIKSRTRWIIIFGVVAGIVTLLTSLIKECLPLIDKSNRPVKVQLPHGKNPTSTKRQE